ncbi:hypothetical protein [Streptomyces europaeiscabiei]|uniref:hypothetical protein n=1 Tax=Streptomyces europaeiscabiei TaxID=146819 RepID=UPI002E175122
MGSKAKADPSQSDSITRLQLNIVVQNPECFPAAVRAAAQDALTQQDQNAARSAMCAASDQPWWNC